MFASNLGSLTMMIIILSFTPKILISQIVSQTANGKFVLNFTSNRVDENHRMIMIGEGEYPIGEKMAHSGKIESMNSSNITLVYNEESKSFELNNSTKTCIKGVFGKSLDLFNIGEKVTVLTEQDNQIAIEIYDRPLEFYFGMGPEFIDFDCKPSKTKSKSNKIFEIQTILNELGYNCGIPDGIIGTHTKDAIEKFEKDNDFPITGVPSAILLNNLKQKQASKK